MFTEPQRAEPKQERQGLRVGSSVRASGTMYCMFWACVNLKDTQNINLLISTENQEEFMGEWQCSNSYQTEWARLGCCGCESQGPWAGQQKNRICSCNEPGPVSPAGAYDAAGASRWTRWYPDQTDTASPCSSDGCGTTPDLNTHRRPWIESVKLNMGWTLADWTCDLCTQCSILVFNCFLSFLPSGLLQ